MEFLTFQFWKDVNRIFSTHYPVPRYNKEYTLQAREAFYELHAAQEKNSVKIFKRKNMENMPES